MDLSEAIPYKYRKIKKEEVQRNTRIKITVSSPTYNKKKENGAPGGSVG